MPDAAPRQPRRLRRILRRIAHIVLPVLALTSAAAWIVTLQNGVAAAYRFGDFNPPSAATKNLWMYRARTIGGSVGFGLVFLRSSEYDSFSPTRQGLDNWKDQTGWQTFRFGVVTPQKGRWLRWTSIKDFSLLGLGLTHSSKQGEDTQALVIPMWLLVVGPASCWFILWIPSTIRRRREATGRCTSCGYSRTGLAANMQCPECGASSQT